MSKELPVGVDQESYVAEENAGIQGGEPVVYARHDRENLLREFWATRRPFRSQESGKLPADVREEEASGGKIMFEGREILSGRINQAVALCRKELAEETKKLAYERNNSIFPLRSEE